MLQIANYRKAYGISPLLTISNLQLQGGMYWLKGENGAGKTTFLKSVAGMIPFDGEISVKGINLRKQRMQYTLTVAFAAAEPVFPAFLTGDDLIRFVEETKGKNDLLKKHIIKGFGMDSYLSKKIGTYSSGMLKKLSLLLAFLGKPQLILLDEPFITLDPEAILFLEKLLAESFENGMSFLVSSHQEVRLNTPVSTLQILNNTIQPFLHATAV